MKLIINNQVVHISEDWTILQACEKLGLFIPRFCYSETLSIAGNCRMCLIEIEKAPKLMPACAIKIANDMKIYTKTNLVKKKSKCWHCKWKNDGDITLTKTGSHNSKYAWAALQKESKMQLPTNQKSKKCVV